MATRGKHRAGKHRAGGRHSKGPIRSFFDFFDGRGTYSGRHRRRTNYGDAT